MPIAPRPSADTVGPFFPSRRLCNFILVIISLRQGGPRPANRRSLLVPKPADHRAPLSLILDTLDSLGRFAIDHSNHAAPPTVFRNDHPQRICGRAKYVADLGHRLNLI